MFRTRERKSKKGFILVYVLFACSLCFLIVLGVYKMEVLIRNNDLKLQQNTMKVDIIQKPREFLLTQLDENIYESVSYISEEGVKEFFNTTTSTAIKYDDNLIKYINDSNCFLAEYYINHKFYKEELYEYKIINGSIFYGCIDYSYKKGGIK